LKHTKFNQKKSTTFRNSATTDKYEIQYGSGAVKGTWGVDNVNMGGLVAEN